MHPPRIGWLIAALPSLPLFCIYFAFRKVLDAKKVEMRMVLERGQSLTKYLAVYGRRQFPSKKDETQEITREETIQRIVNRVFGLQYSAEEYWPAILFCFVVITLLTAISLILAGFELGLTGGIQEAIRSSPFGREVVAGGFGSLTWAIYELAEQYRSGGLAPDNLFSLATRIIIGATVGAMIGTFAKPDLAWPLAFAAGALPIRTIRSFLTDRALAGLKLSAAPETSAHPSLELIQGWTPDVASRLARAGVTSAEQLACTDPFQTFLRSNLPWRVILDLSDQALLLMYVGENIKKLRPLGIRSAVELAFLGWRTDEPKYHYEMSHTDAFKCVATATETSVENTKLLIRSLADDLTVEFLASLWTDDTPAEDEEDVESDESTDAITT
jgi:hypothetical protein